MRLHHYKKVSLVGWEAYLPDEPLFGEHTLRKIRASVLSSMMGVTVNTALDYVKDSSGPKEPEEFKFINESKSYCTAIIHRLEKVLMKIEPSDTLRIELIRNAFGRLDASFEAAIFLIYEGFNFEPKAILRLILENLNFIYQVNETNDDKETYIEDLCRKYKISNTSMSNLKKFHLKIDLGRLYGLLSSYTHFEPQTQNTMITWGMDEAKVYLKSKQFIYENFFILMVLLELSQDLFLFVFRGKVNVNEVIDSDLVSTNSITGLRYPKSEELLKMVGDQVHTINNPNNNLFDVLKRNRD